MAPKHEFEHDMKMDVEARVREGVKGVEGETVTMYFGSPKAEFDEFAPEAQKVVDSVKWGGS